MSIITYPLNGVVYSAEDVATYLCTRTSGVYSKETNFAVSITGTRQITVAPGLAWINYDDFKGVSVCSREENVLTVPEADNILNRVDRVVLQFDTSENITAIKLKIGTPARTIISTSSACAPFRCLQAPPPLPSPTSTTRAQMRPSAA